jgi:peptidoglycan/xylan/chitin deacetylase (PgdA/CDA1 family)
VFRVPANFFCYPAGRYDAAVIAAVQRAGYEGAEAEIPKEATPADRWALGRFEILRGTGAAGLESLVRG